MNANEVKNTLVGHGYITKDVTRSRIAIVTDKRQAALDHAMEIFKKHNPRLVKDASALRISSLGIIQLNGVQIIAKPATKNVLKAEQEATEALIGVIRQAVQQEGKPITVKIGKYSIPNVITAGSDQIKGDPKADIALIDSAGKEVGFISHKKEGGAKAYQQYGGISKERAQADKTLSLIYDDILVYNFVKDLGNYLKTNVGKLTAKSGTSVWREIPQSLGKMLVGRSVYGLRWRQGKPGTFNRDSVHCIGQGKPILTRNTNGDYDLTFSETMHTADDISWAFKGEYKAILAATFRQGRRIENKGIVITDMRGGVYPYDFISGRKASKI